MEQADSDQREGKRGIMPERRGTGISNLVASLHHTGRRRVVLGHMLNTCDM